MRRLSVGLLLLLFAACVPPQSNVQHLPVAHRAPRSRRSAYRFRVLATTVPNEIRHDLGLREIALLPGATGSDLRIQGLTTIRHAVATHTRFETATRSLFVKAWFDDVIVVVSISSVIIHIPLEYPEGSCEYEAVLAHEREHGKLARENAADLAGEIEAEISWATGLPTRKNPMESPDHTAVEDILKASISRITDPIYERYELDEKREQAALDRPDPYNAVYRKCRDWK